VGGGVLKIALHIWEVGVAGTPVIGRRQGVVLNITAAVWSAGFHWWRSGNKSERKMLASICLCSLYAWFILILLFRALIYKALDRQCVVFSVYFTDKGVVFR